MARTGFTLIELVLVVAVIATIFALATPGVIRMVGRQSLTRAADRTRVAMGQARVEAIRTGEVQAFYFEPRGNWFGVGAFSAIQSQASIAANEKQRAARQGNSRLESNVLPPGVFFASGEASTDARSADTFSRSSSGSASSGNIVIQPILFYPDGTSQDVKLYIRDSGQTFVTVELRGLTGIASAQPPAPISGSGSR